MPKVRTEPWSDYAEWLSVERGLGPASVSTYSAQVRRVLREVPDLTGDSVLAWIDARPESHRGAYRASYRAFRSWLLKERTLEIPDLTTVATAGGIPPEIVTALRLLRADGLPSRAIHTLTWRVDDTGAAAKQYPHLVFFVVPKEGGGDGCSLRGASRAATDALRAWGYPDREPTESDPVVPRRPGATIPMPLAALRRLCGKTVVY